VIEMRLSVTQRSLVSHALEDHEQGDQDWFLRGCVYPRNLTGLIRAGAVELVDGKYRVTDSAAALVRQD
jgi:hypothetical protein